MPTQSPTDRSLVLAAAPIAVRAALSTLFALDDRLADIVRTTREPLVGQMRLTWWYEALVALDSTAAPAEPLLQDVQRTILPLGIPATSLAGMVDGWEALIVVDPVDIAAIARHAQARGAGLFGIAARILGADSPLLVAAGEGWALADLAAHLSAPALADTATELAGDRISQAFSGNWPRRLRPIALLSLIAGLDRTVGSPIGKAFRVAQFRLTGR
ncbi:phytoene synthase [Sphingomonas insulae]|uniref:Phytoene synthase n=1 Tax=Sphingomonas insulae TaxID=424800 RepID=A0ABN1HR45_9SPHN|nr:squalene/phytoene synthase family protein [Sphingomonas insulae]NIJ29256.1 phytoene synthase [Sphingomonas insulae]